MPIATTCPNCRALFRLADDMAGETVKCQKCAHVFIVPRTDEKTVAPGVSALSPPINLEIDKSPAAPMVTAAPPPIPDKQANSHVEADEEPTRPSGKRSGPPPISKKHTEKPTTRRERRSPSESGSGVGMMAVVVILLGGGLLGCLGCAGVIGWFVWDADQKKTQLAAADKKAKPVVDDKKEIIKKEFEKKFDEKKLDDNPPPGGINVTLDANGTYRSDSSLNAFDVFDQGRRKKIYTVHLTAGQTYQIDMVTQEFDPYLFLINDLNQIVAQDDDTGEGLNAQIVYRATRTGFHRIHATHFGAGQVNGNFTLFVRRNVKF